MNRILYAADCLEVLNDSNALPDESVDLIYLDPPFNSNSRYNLPFEGRDKNLRPVEAFNDTWHWTDENSVQFEELESNPINRPLADIIRFAQSVEQGVGARHGGGANKPSFLFDEYGDTPARYETGSEVYREHLPTL